MIYQTILRRSELQLLLKDWKITVVASTVDVAGLHDHLQLISYSNSGRTDSVMKYRLPQITLKQVTQLVQLLQGEQENDQEIHVNMRSISFNPSFVEIQIGYSGTTNHMTYCVEQLTHVWVNYSPSQFVHLPNGQRC